MLEKLILLFGAVALTTHTTQAQIVTPLFTLDSDQPVVAHGLSGGWDAGYINPGAMIYHAGKFHMLRNGFRTWPGQVEIGYTISDDGYRWRAVGAQPVFSTTDVSYAGVLAMASSVLVDEDGTWVLYFYTWKNRTFPQKGTIGRATAPSPAGPWTVDPVPLLTTGVPGAFDAGHIEVPLVVRNEEGYFMYYSAFDDHNLSQIGMATSQDGVHWTKAAAPILCSGTERRDWDQNGVGRPRVVETPEGWVMLYRDAGTTELGLARSADGIDWTKDERNPVIVPAQIPRGNSYWIYDLLYQDETYFVYAEAVSSDPASSDVFLFTHHRRLFGG